MLQFSEKYHWSLNFLGHGTTPASALWPQTGIVLFLLEASRNICVNNANLALGKCKNSESEREVAQSCPALLRSREYSPPDSSVHGISQARLLEWVAISFSRGSSLPRDGTHFSCVVRQILYHWVTGRALEASTRSIMMKYSSFLWRIFMRDPQQCWNHAPILILCPWLPSPPSLYMFLKIYDFCFLRLLYSPI